jgi:hypothetical protein
VTAVQKISLDALALHHLDIYALPKGEPARQGILLARVAHAAGAATDGPAQVPGSWA